MAYREPGFLPEDEENIQDTSEAALLPPEEIPGLEVDPEILAARMERDNRVAQSSLLEGISDIGAAIGGTKADRAFYEKQRALANQGVSDATKDAGTRSKAVSDYLKNKRMLEAINSANTRADKQIGLQEEKLAQQAKESERQNNINNRRLDLMEKGLNSKEALAQAKIEADAAAAAAKPTKGEEAVDKAYGKDYAGRISEGGYSDPEKQLSGLDDAITRLGKTDSATGPLVSMVPDYIRKRVMPEGVAIQDQIEDVVQRNLRKVLGAQFTDQEGKRLIARAYNPALSEGENLKRLGRLKTQMANALKTQKAADDYFKEHGSLKGYSGKQASMSDFNPESDLPGGESPPPGGESPPPGGGEVERKTKDGRIGIFDAETKSFIRYKE